MRVKRDAVEPDMRTNLEQTRVRQDKAELLVSRGWTLYTVCARGDPRQGRP